MSDTGTIARTKFRTMVDTAQAAAQPASTDSAAELEYRWRGQRFRTVPMQQAPLMQFRLAVSQRESMHVKYAYITHQVLNQQNEEHKNEIEMIIRDTIRVTFAGFNLGELDDALLIQQVSEIHGVSLMQAEAALQREPGVCVITDVSVEYGRFDVENRQWLQGHGFWCPRERRWVPQVRDTGW